MRTHPGFYCLVAFLALCSNAQPTPSAELTSLLKTGSELSQRADYQHAIPLLKRAVELAPQDPLANFWLGITLLESGHPSDAAVPLRVAANATPVNEAAEGYLGDVEMELKDFAMAADAFQSAVARSPDSEQVLVWWTGFSLERYRGLAFSLRESSKGRAALLQVAAQDSKAPLTTKESLLKQAVTLNPELDGIWGELGVAQAQLGKETEAEANLKAAQQRQPDTSSTLQLEALLDASNGNWPEVEKKCLTLDQRSPAELMKFLAAWPSKLLPGAEMKGVIAQCLRERREHCVPASNTPDQTNVPASVPRADRFFEEGRWEQLAAMPAPPADNSKEWFWRGLAFAKLSDCLSAIPALERGLKAGAEVAAAWLTTCYEAAAVHTADKLKADGKEGSVHQIRGDILLSIRLDPARAVQEYTEALKLKHKDPALLEKLAETYFSLGDMSKAKQSAQEALEQNPHRRQLLRLLVRIAMSERDYTGALALLDRLAQVQPDDPWTRVQQATAYAQTGQPEQAVQRLKSALDAGYPDEKGSLHALLASQLRKLGRDQEAKDATDKAVKLADSFQQQDQNKSDDAP
jgi:tetratricopeptide (TPR) repeat protein